MPVSLRRFLNSSRRRLGAVFAAMLCLCLLSGCAPSSPLPETGSNDQPIPSSEHVIQTHPIALEAIPEYSDKPYLVLENGEPSFADVDYASAYGTEIYGILDELGRATGAFAMVGPETLPTEDRKRQYFQPTGWNNDAYNGEKLYERCHLIAHCLTGEDNNPQNLFTGTHYLNHTGMRDHENAILDYVRATGNHVLMRVVPVFEGNELVARGVHMEALSIEDDGKGVKLNIYLYNVQPGISIDYATGKSHQESVQEVSTAANGSKAAIEESEPEAGTDEVASTAADEAECAYILNTNTMRFHTPGCRSASAIKEYNRQDVTATRSNLINQGYKPCGVCNP